MMNEDDVMELPKLSTQLTMKAISICSQSIRMRKGRQSRLNCLLVFFIAIRRVSALAGRGKPSDPNLPTSAIYSVTAHPPSGSSSKARTPVLLIHGLDSSSATWRNVMPDLATSRLVIAMDCRGCGYSADINESAFDLPSLVQDVHDCLSTHAVHNKIVLLGHSMGARIALSFAATYPERVQSLIMEDMDIARRPVESAPFAVATDKSPFVRSFDSEKDAIQALLRAGYPQDRVDGWVADGRIHKRDEQQRWWSSVNPDFRRLCYQRVVDNDLGERACRAIAETGDFAVHALVAGPEGTICSDKSLQDMQTILGPKRFTLHRFPAAAHSIHSSDRDNFLQTVQRILSE